MTTPGARVVPKPRPSSRLSPSDAYRIPLRALRRAQGAVGRRLSIRTKLTLWYAVVYALTLAVIGLALPTVLAGQSRSLINTSLQSTGRQTLLDLAKPSTIYGAGGRSCKLMSKPLQAFCAEVQHFLEINSTRLGAPGQFEQVQFFDPRNGHSQLLVPRGRSGTQNVIPVSSSLLSDIASSGQPKTQSFRQSREDVLGYLTPLQLPVGLRQGTYRTRTIVGVLEVFQPEHNFQAIRTALTTVILLLGIPLGVVLALLIGWWIARAALRPINRISRTVQAIGDSRDLSRRLNFVGPHDEVGRLADTFDGMMTRIEGVFETQKRFVADASHELRTPLTAIRGNADLLKIAPPEEREVCISAIRREAERMSRLVADLLLLAAADIEEQPVHIQRVELCALLEDVHRSAGVLADDNVSVELHAPDALTVEADPDRIKQLILNLVDNAIKFTPQGGRVSIALIEEPDGAAITVADTGSGIPPQEQESIFRAFYRTEGSRTKRGSGLGLAISAWIVSAHGGTIDVSSEPGKGSTFTVHLPRGGPSGDLSQSRPD